MKRLIKSYDRVFAGVCGGISDYINPEMDPLIIRLLWAVFSVFNPFLILVYLVLALVMPTSQAIESK
ncbi:PspC domain-containing protein [Mangrovibacterium marinum]|uniref:Phage shock protein C (PspC) family protein n=1 Tax=Mangrovibacterium marinum TaxID=1639118 RepID=A0A2T5C2X4_9BACT|nr:PspC domain-containing protein [Mangrovibacterium marinum]PTN09068.1 phage shock protein C (PspC) family protein [Mangrovibacterium marinum]